MFRKATCYLTTYSGYFNYAYIGNIIFIFLVPASVLRNGGTKVVVCAILSVGVVHIKESLLLIYDNDPLPTPVTLSNYQQGFFYKHHPSDRIAYSTAFITPFHRTPVEKLWLEREIAQWVHHEGLIRQPITP